MANCVTDILKNITSDCTTQRTGGVKPEKVWFAKRSDLTFTYSNTKPSLITNFAVAVGAKLWLMTGVKKLFNSGHTLTAAANRANRFSHTFHFEVFEIDSDANAQLDAAEDMVVIYERKNETGEGTFVVRGAKMGLYPSADTASENENDGARIVDWSSMEGALEPFAQNPLWMTDYATTLAALVDAETIAA